jgi:hypothetical protein
MRSNQDPRPAHASLQPAYDRIVAAAARPCTIVRTLHSWRAARASFVEPAFRSRSGCAGPGDLAVDVSRPDFAPQLGYWSTPLRTSSRDSSRTGTEPTFQISDA